MYNLYMYMYLDSFHTYSCIPSGAHKGKESTMQFHQNIERTTMVITDDVLSLDVSME